MSETITVAGGGAVLDNTNNEGIIDAKIAVPLKALSNFWRIV